MCKLGKKIIHASEVSDGGRQMLCPDATFNISFKTLFNTLCLRFILQKLS